MDYKKWRGKNRIVLHELDSWPRTYDMPKSAEKSLRMQVVMVRIRGNDYIRGEIASFNGHTKHSEKGPGLFVDAKEADRIGAHDLAKAVRLFEKKSKLFLDMHVSRREPKPPLVVAMDRVARFMRSLPPEQRRTGVPVNVIKSGVRMDNQMRWDALNEMLERKRMRKSPRGVKGKPKLWQLVEDKEGKA